MLLLFFFSDTTAWALDLPLVFDGSHHAMFTQWEPGAASLEFVSVRKEQLLLPCCTATAAPHAQHCLLTGLECITLQFSVSGIYRTSDRCQLNLMPSMTRWHSNVYIWNTKQKSLAFNIFEQDRLWIYKRTSDLLRETLSSHAHMHTQSRAHTGTRVRATM